ncbi:MAG: DUF4276 family protein [Candidatus Glassbacteria bacterium]
MHLEFLVEEPSMEAALMNIVPKIIPASTTFYVHPFPDKPTLLKELPKRLKGYRRWIPDSYRIIVLVDEDRKDCHELKAKLERAALNAGFHTKSRNSDGIFQVINRVVVEELEAWFFGDWEAVRQAFPRVSRTIPNKKKYRYPDKITGGTWEALERIFRYAGYFPGGLEKITAAKEISRFMEPDRNRSHSFKVFREGLRSMEHSPG